MTYYEIGLKFGEFLRYAIIFYVGYKISSYISKKRKKKKEKV